MQEKYIVWPITSPRTTSLYLIVRCVVFVCHRGSVQEKYIVWSITSPRTTSLYLIVRCVVFVCHRGSVQEKYIAWSITSPRTTSLYLIVRCVVFVCHRGSVQEKYIAWSITSPRTTSLYLILSLNKGNIFVLALLDFSSAFDTIDHTILVHRLHTDFGFTDSVLQWFSSYRLIVHTTSLYLISALLLLMYTQVFLRVQFLALYFSPCIFSLCLPLLTHTIIHHSFADDLQLQMSAPPDRISELLHSMQSCISDVNAWATANMLKLNDSKTELMLVTSKRTKHLHSLPTSITIGNA